MSLLGHKRKGDSAWFVINAAPIRPEIRTNTIDVIFVSFWSVTFVGSSRVLDLFTGVMFVVAIRRRRRAISPSCIQFQ